MAKLRLIGIVLALFASACSSGSSGESPTTTPPPATTTAAPTTMAAPATTTTTVPLDSDGAPPPESGELIWTPVPDDDAVFGGPDAQYMNSVVAGGPGLVAVGADGPWGGADAAVWVSVDGVAWNRVPDDDAVLGGQSSLSMNSVVAAGPGLVAVGSDVDMSDGSSADAAVWVSVDGVAWNRVPDDDAVFGGPEDQSMNSVVAGGPGLVAVGYDGTFGENRDAAVWWSDDGVSWTRVPGDDAVFGGPEDQYMNEVVAGGPGLVAVGSDGFFGERDAAVWVSVDGVSWTRVPDDEDVFGGPGDQAMYSVAAAGPGLVAVGVGGPEENLNAAVWLSVDGISWDRVPDDDAVFGGPESQYMFSVVAGGPGLVAAGADKSGGNRDAAVWLSVDGVSWTRVSGDDAVFGGPESQSVSEVVAGGPGLVAVGHDGASGERDAAVWVAAGS